MCPCINQWKHVPERQVCYAVKRELRWHSGTEVSFRNKKFTTRCRNAARKVLRSATLSSNRHTHHNQVKRPAAYGRGGVLGLCPPNHQPNEEIHTNSTFRGRKCHNVTTIHSSVPTSDLDTEKPAQKPARKASQPSPTKPRDPRSSPRIIAHVY